MSCVIEENGGDLNKSWVTQLGLTRVSAKKTMLSQRDLRLGGGVPFDGWEEAAISELKDFKKQPFLTKDAAKKKKVVRYGIRKKKGAVKGKGYLLRIG